MLNYSGQDGPILLRCSITYNVVFTVHFVNSEVHLLCDAAAGCFDDTR